MTHLIRCLLALCHCLAEAWSWLGRDEQNIEETANHYNLF